MALVAVSEGFVIDPYSSFGHFGSLGGFNGFGLGAFNGFGFGRYVYLSFLIM